MYAMNMFILYFMSQLLNEKWQRLMLNGLECEWDPLDFPTINALIVKWILVVQLWNCHFFTHIYFTLINQDSYVSYLPIYLIGIYIFLECVYRIAWNVSTK